MDEILESNSKRVLLGDRAGKILRTALEMFALELPRPLECATSPTRQA